MVEHYNHARRLDHRVDATLLTLFNAGWSIAISPRLIDTLRFQDTLVIIECAECRSYVDATERGGFEQLSDDRAPSTLFSLLSCSKCGSPILVRQTNIGNMAEGDKWDTPQLVFPSADLRVNPNARQNIRMAFDEACTCYRANAFTASTIMCRKTLEGICEAHGVKERTLAASLKKMHETHLIDDRLFEWSDLMRVAGNEAAHGVGLTINQADAKDILEFTNAIMDYLFSYRDRFDEFKKRRGKATGAEKR